MSVELLLDAQVVDLATIHELWEGLRRVTFINFKNIIWFGKDFFWEEVAVKIWNFGTSNCVFEFSTLMHIIRVLRKKWVGLLSTELL